MDSEPIIKQYRKIVRVMISNNPHNTCEELKIKYMRMTPQL